MEKSRPEVMKKIDPHLRRVLRDFSRGYLLKREKALAGPDFEKLRTELAEVKDEALSRAEELVALFEAKASQKGARVYRAADSAEANRRVYEILKSNGVRFLVKSKSMVSEETGLNAFLEKRGVKVRETDLGEWILQLAEEQPTHMVMPAIHLTRQDVARIFSRRLSRDVPDEIPALVRLAREELRREIFRAGAGLTGANALVAENGSVLLVTNEGNGRMVSTLPPLLIVLTSVEKILPGTRDALLLLKVLPASATGQNITSYVSFIAPSPQKNLHIILLDNHRSEILRDPVFREILRCIKCSACLNVCPVYQMVGGKRYAHVYMGGIGTLFTAWIHGLAASRDLADYCLGCHRCETFCAAKIRVPDLVMALRERLNRATGKRLWKRLAFDGVIGHPKVTRALFSSVRASGPLVARRGEYARRLPPLLRKYDRFRALPRPAPESLSARAQGKAPQETASEGPRRVLLFAGCLVEHFYPRIGLDALSVLERLGYEAGLADPACCGFPAANAGFREAAAKTFRRLTAGLEHAGAVLTLCPTCTTMLAHLGPEILGTEKARHLARRVVPFSRFLLERDRPRLERLLSPRPPGHPVTYHDSCHHKYVLQASGASRELLELALGGKLREMEDADSCCGFAGSFSVSHPEVSASLLETKLESIRGSGARVVAMDCPGCLLQIRGGAKRRGEKLDVRHTAEILAACLGKNAI
jgi:L-lactate dehydrogenase complex protein LldF